MSKQPKVPWSRSSVAACISSPSAAKANQAPTDTRRTPSAVSSATGGHPGPRDDVHGSVDLAEQPAQVVGCGYARSEEHVRARLLVALQPLDRVGQVRPAVYEVL